MPPRIPIELSNAKYARELAWKNYMDAIDNGESREMIDERYETARLLDDHAKSIYDQWQELGGTSDIVSIALYKAADVVDIERWQDEDWQDEKDTQNSVRPTLY